MPELADEVDRLARIAKHLLRGAERRRERSRRA